MTADYTQRLRQHLKEFSPEEREAFLEEMRSHIESAEDDPRLGSNREERIQKLMAELGSAKDLGGNLKAVYHPSRFIDYLWIAIPYLLYPYLNALYVSLMPKYPWADVRLDILLHLPLVIVGLWRRSATVTLFWLGTLITQIAAMLLITRGYYGAVQTAFWWMFMLTLIILLGYLAWQNRSDFQIVVFALLPILMCLAGSLAAIVHPNAAASYGALDLVLLKIYTEGAMGSGYLPFYGTLIALTLFVLVTDRNIRWLALGLYGLVIGLSRTYINLFDSENGMMTQWAYVLFAILPLVIVFLGWWSSQPKGYHQVAE